MKKLLLIFCSILFMIINHSYGQSQSISTSLNIDLNGGNKKKESVVGFLHYNSLVPLSNDINILKPKFWRVGSCIFPSKGEKMLSNVNFLIDNGITPILVLSDLIKVTPNNKNSTWSMKASNVKDVNQVITDAYKKFGNTIIYDLWNEPNLVLFWQGPKEEAFQIMLQEYKIIRSMPGGDKATITAPSIAGFDKNYIEQFLDFCQDNHMQIDILNWHQNGNLADAFKMAQNVDYAKKNWVDGRPNLNIKSIYIPEVMGHADQFDPLTILGYIYNAEKSGVSCICKSCWDNPPNKGGRTCWNNSMDGIIDENGAPRSIWWIYKFYAESLSRRVNSTMSSNLISFSYLSNKQDTLSSIFGINSTTSQSVNISVKSLDKILALKTSNIKVSTYFIPNSDQDTLNMPKWISTITLAVKNGSTKLALKSVNSKGVYLLKIYK